MCAWGGGGGVNLGEGWGLCINSNHVGFAALCLGCVMSYAGLTGVVLARQCTVGDKVSHGDHGLSMSRRVALGDERWDELGAIGYGP